MKKKRAIFLDRDGVLNRAFIKNGRPYPPKNINELEILPGVVNSIEALHDAGFRLIVVTNQPDVARGLVDIESVEEINNYLLHVMKIDEFKTCYHDDSDLCDFRKPNPGALIHAANEYSIDLRASYMVGDRWRDMEAGQRAGCKTIFIQYNYAEPQPQSPTYIVKSLAEATEKIFGEM